MSRRSAIGVVVSVALMVTACGGGANLPTSSPFVSFSGVSPRPTLAADWPEYHRNSARTGLGPATPALGDAHAAWTAKLDADVYASPLIVAGHVIAVTENNTVYALDLFSGTVVWQAHLGDPVDASSLPCGDIGPVSGITGTPAADVSTGRLYVVAFLRGGHHVLFTLRLVDGSEVSRQVVDPVGSDPSAQQERGALAIGSGYVYVPLGGLFGDCGTYYGYVVAAPEVGGTPLAYRTPVREAGIWSAAGPTIAESGAVYVVTGNGAAQSNFGYSNSVIELSPDLRVKSYFTPSNWKELDAGDTDLGSLGATLVPSLGVVLAVGKEGVAYLLKADKLGGIGGQITSQPVCESAFGGTAWSGSTVFVPCTDGLVALALTATSITVAWRAPHPAVGSPIVAAGAVWGIEPASGKVYALDPASGSVMYSTSAGVAQHFSTPAATDGFIVAPAGSSVVAISTTA